MALTRADTPERPSASGYLRGTAAGTRARWHLPVALALGLLAMIAAGVAMQVWGPAMNDPDSMSSVLYFQRIVGGERLEVFNLTTPKPLLTAVYGLTWAVFHDWRAIVLESLLAYGTAVFAASLLAYRIGGAVAGTFVGTFLIGSSPMLLEVAQANSLVWAVAAWALAGLALAQPSRRCLVAGIALLVAATARPETFILLGLATGAVALLWLLERGGRSPVDVPPARSLLPLLIGWVAMAIQLGHDLLLTGDPFFWLNVPVGYTQLVYPGLSPMSLGAYLQELMAQFADERVLLGVALLGVGYLAWRRQWMALIGVAALGPGVLLLLTRLAMQGVFIDPRYYEPPTLAIAFGAGMGLALLGELAARAWPALIGRGRSTLIAGAAVGALLAILATYPLAPLDDAVAQRFRSVRAASANLGTLMPEIRLVLAKPGGPAPPAVPGAGGYPVVNPSQVTVFVPRSLQRRVAIEANVLLTRIGDNQVTFGTTPPEEILRPGQFIYHDANVDQPADAFTAFETGHPVRLGLIRLVPLHASPTRGSWWLGVEAADEQ